MLYRKEILSKGPCKLLSAQFFILFFLLAYPPQIARAQDNPEEVSETQDEAPESVEEIVVTGSRLKRSSLTTPVQITSIDSDDISLSGETDIASLVQEIPALFSSTNTEQSGEIVGVSVGTAVLDLRSLGSKRTLVLVDGRRHVGGRAGDTAVDINSIPSALIERVEVITGGASAVYGADAVSGVVNIITKKQFEGIEAEAQSGISSRGDAFQSLVGVTGGSNFSSGKGNATFSIQYHNQNSIKYGDRDWSKNNGIADDYPNPALFHQSGDNIGQAIEPEPNVPARVIRRQPTFAISSKHGRVGVDINGDGYVDLPGETPFFLDTNNNGVNDIGETFLGRNGFGDWVYDGNEFRLFRTGAIAGFANQFGGDGIEVSFDWADMIPQTEHVVADGSFRYSINPHISYFAEAKFVTSSTAISGTVNSFNDTLTISNQNPYMPTRLREALDSFLASNTDPAFDNPQVFITRDMTDMGVAGAWVERNTFRAVTGFEGDLANGWSYEVSVNFGRTNERYTNRNARIEDRYYAAIDAVQDPDSGNIVCRSDLVVPLAELEELEAAGQPHDAAMLAKLRELDPRSPPPTSPFPEFKKGFFTFEPGDGQCKPMNLFGRGAPSQESIDFVTADDLNNDIIEQQVVLATLSGDSSEYFELPDGPIGFAAGFEYRREASSSAVSGLQRAKLLFASGTQPLRGNYDVYEGFAELSIPILANRFLAEELTLEGAIRQAHYSTIGDTTTWSARGIWAPVDDVKLRGSVSRAIRAPNIFELFQTKTVAFFRPIDPCEETQIDQGPNPENRLKNCRAIGIPEGFVDPLTGRFEGLAGGNEDLQEEIADSYTVGLAFTPTFLPGLLLTADKWDIEITDAIEFPTDQDIVDSCYDAASMDNNPFCKLIGRDKDTLGLNYLEQQMMNIAAKHVAGIDVGFIYEFRTVDWFESNFGVFELSGNVNHLSTRYDIRVKSDPSSKDPELGEITRPRWAGSLGLRWMYEYLVANYQLRWIGNQYLATVEAENAKNFSPNSTGVSFIHDIQVRYNITEEMSLYAGVNNLLDRNPFINRISYPVSAIGRYFYFGLNSRFN